MTRIGNIPDGLLGLNHFPDDVSILIGENGSGKSTLLHLLSTHYLREGKDVVALANSIHDKFESRHKNFKTLRGRSGRKQSRVTIKNALQAIAESDLQKLKNVSQALKYVGFDPYIGFRIEKFVENFRSIIGDSDLPEGEKEQLRYLLDKTIRESDLSKQHFDSSQMLPDESGYQIDPRQRNQRNYSSTEIIWLGIETFDFNALQKSSLIELFLWESRLKELKVIERIEVFLRKENHVISMLEASSGELALITSIVYLTTIITEKTVVLIDEPENSLHPKWQKEYVNTLLEVFYLYQPKIIIATHSPLIVNGAELFIKDPQVYKSSNFTFELQKKEPLNIEETLFRFFDVTTPQNRFLSDRLVRYLNLIANGKISFQEFQNEIEKIELNSYDPKQIEVLKSVISIASDISSTNPNSEL